MLINPQLYALQAAKSQNFKKSTVCTQRLKTERKLTKLSPDSMHLKHLAFCGLVDYRKLKRFEEIIDTVLDSPKTFNEHKEELRKLQDTLLDYIPTQGDMFAAGTHNQTYHLKGTKYIARMPIWANFMSGEVKFNENNTFDKLKLWYGKELLTCGNAGIMRNADPEKIGISACSSHQVQHMRNVSEHYSNTYLPKLANTPQRSFDALAEDFKTLNQISYQRPNGYMAYFQFDKMNPSNFMLVGDKIIVLDDISEDVFKDYNNLDMMVEVLINKTGHRQPVGHNKNNDPFVRESLKKCVLACEKSDLPLPEVWDADPEYPDINYSFHVAGLDGKWKQVREKLTELRNVQDKEARISATENYLNEALKAD